ncbi:uncharacterized protein N7506_001213 [Penicillium brevicompactum]|uniref:uncharacterized protein n=1 Tax=Penicillium brevicompactum TaxID=5074 RepID=UPI002540308E|nr:uncharacterized protein N7506_001213 [Penicillium brevicompactum]KAJ5347960.1 hypothetical protein N7506_001213 [Penicillium brevicompactum]
MSYFRTEYQRFLDNPKAAKLAGDISLIYVPTTTKFDQPDNVITHVLKQSHIVKTRSHNVISAIEGSDALCLDMETTLEFREGGGAYLPSLDDNFLADRVVTFPTIHIVHFDSENQIKQIRIHWDQASLLRQVEVIGARGRAWPIRDAKDQIRLLKTSVTARSSAAVPAPSQQTTPPPRSSSPHKRYTKDPYAAESLTELLSPSKEIAELEARAQPPSLPLLANVTPKTHTERKAPAAVAPFAPSSSRPATRNFSDIFVKDDDVPDSPSKPQRRAPRVPEEDETAHGPVDEDRHFYKSIPGKYNHFEIGGDNLEHETKNEAKHANSYHKPKWDFDDFTTPTKDTRAPRGEEVRHFDVSEDEGPDDIHVVKPRRDAERHFELTDDEEDEGRIISSFGGRGKGLYENRLFDDEEGPELSAREKKNEPLAVTGNNKNRDKNFNSQFDIVDDSPVSKENAKPTAKHDKAVKMMESHWDNYDETPQPKRTATSLRNPKTHNQPSWQFGDE